MSLVSKLLPMVRYPVQLKPWSLRFHAASRKIQSIASVLRLSEVVCLAATRLYTLAVEHKFTKGRKSLNVVAVCLYVACRQKETRNYMLIDFSDLLQVRFSKHAPILSSQLIYRSTYLNSDTHICNWCRLSTSVCRSLTLPITSPASQHYLNLAQRLPASPLTP